MALFIFIYVGVEVTISGKPSIALQVCGFTNLPVKFSGWIVTYVINERHGGVNAGYISSGFWGGKMSASSPVYVRLTYFRQELLSEGLFSSGSVTE